MAEYIEREALREAFIKHFDAVYDDGKLVFSDHICTAEDCEDILKLVAELPTADFVEVKHGEWIYVPETYTLKSGYVCSVCESTTWHSHDVPQAFKYCPDCSAKMDGKGGVQDE